MKKLSNIQGNLMIYLSHCKGLIGKDETGFRIFKKENMNGKTSDPFVIINLT
jgi:hypothetical protein